MWLSSVSGSLALAKRRIPVGFESQPGNLSVVAKPLVRGLACNLDSLPQKSVCKGGGFSNVANVAS